MLWNCDARVCGAERPKRAVEAGHIPPPGRPGQDHDTDQACGHCGSRIFPSSQRSVQSRDRSGLFLRVRPLRRRLSHPARSGHAAAFDTGDGGAGAGLALGLPPRGPVEARCRQALPRQARPDDRRYRWRTQVARAGPCYIRRTESKPGKPLASAAISPCRTTPIRQSIKQAAAAVSGVSRSEMIPSVWR